MRRLGCIGTAKESQNANQNWVICVRLDEHSAHPDNRKYSAGRLARISASQLRRFPAGGNIV